MVIMLLYLSHCQYLFLRCWNYIVDCTSIIFLPLFIWNIVISQRMSYLFLLSLSINKYVFICHVLLSIIGTNFLAIMFFFTSTSSTLSPCSSLASRISPSLTLLGNFYFTSTIHSSSKIFVVYNTNLVQYYVS